MASNMKISDAMLRKVRKVGAEIAKNSIRCGQNISYTLSSEEKTPTPPEAQ